MTLPINRTQVGYSAKQDELLREFYPTHMPIDEICEIINAAAPIGAPKRSRKGIVNHAALLKLSRPGHENFHGGAVDRIVQLMHEDKIAALYAKYGNYTSMALTRDVRFTNRPATYVSTASSAETTSLMGDRERR